MSGESGEPRASDFAFLAIVNEPSRTPLFFLAHRIRGYACHFFMFLHLVVIMTLFDILSYPVRLICGVKAGRGRLLLRYQLNPSIGLENLQTMMTDIDLGDAISGSYCALKVISPGMETTAQALAAARSLLTANDGSGFKQLAASYTTPHWLEPRAATETQAAVVKKAVVSTDDLEVKSLSGAPVPQMPDGTDTKWAQAFFEFRGRASPFFLEYQTGSWAWYCFRRYPILPIGIFFLGGTWLGIFFDVLMSPLLIVASLINPKWLVMTEPGNQILLHLVTEDQGGEGVKHKYEGFTTVLRTDYEGPSFTAGFNKCCRGSYQRWAFREMMRTFNVPQEMQLHRLVGQPEEGPGFPHITNAEMLEKLQAIKLTCSCCC
mmetsp:Transcript_6868/g.14998  ORF Transcript_6868/g.14998 Transcript_6868/m.14998 type:complete len:376 (-) Transcript_6868:222-1349(-)